jgi:TolA-binding protein
LAVSVGPGASAQTQDPPPGIEWDKKRLERLERNVRRLERAIGQFNENGEPLIIQPDPETVALQGQVEVLSRRVSDLEETLRRVNGQLEQNQFDFERSQRALSDRIATLESRLGAAEEALAVPTSATGDSKADFDAAMQMMMAGEYAAAARAWEAYVQVWPQAPETAEAWYRLGETRYIGSDGAGAAAAYATALKGWPRTRWAPDATAKLAASLADLGRNREACAAVGEFDRRYASAAAAAVKARAASTRTKAQCG